MIILNKYNEKLNNLKNSKIGEASEFLGHNKIPADKFDKKSILYLGSDVDSQAITNSRISNLEIKDRKTGSWNLIDNDKIYLIATNSFIATGKDGYGTFKRVQEENGIGTNTYLDYAMSFIRYVENLNKNGEKLTKLSSSEYPIKSFK
jgi:2',3'-cyclic-nucleotide 2'-phosphodiesterase (5'-nucleotidase family)